MKKISRKNFLRAAGVTSIGLSVTPGKIFSNFSPITNKAKTNNIKIGFIGVGLRGREHVSVVSKFPNVSILALCDIDENAISATQDLLEQNGLPKAQEYSKDEKDYLNLLSRVDLDAVIISTPWNLHTPMAVDAMKAGKYTGLEVSAATTLQECWDLVNTHESTGTNLMLLENVCSAREVLAVANMLKENLLGIPVHATCGYRHDLRSVKFNNGKQPYGGGVEFGEKGFSEAKRRTQFSLKRNADLYPTHGIGPVAQWFNITRGNTFVSITSTASKSVGLREYILNHPEGGEEHPNAKLEWKLGDIITSVIKTSNEETIIITHDTNLPRPYSWGFTLHGTKGVWNGEYEGRRIYIEDQSPSHRWEYNDRYDKYMKEYDSELWKQGEKKAENAGHGGIDYFLIEDFINCVRENKVPSIDVYDAAIWSAITPLSEASIASNGAPQIFPDFTRGRWIDRK